jgi:hypothetical protein
MKYVELGVSGFGIVGRVFFSILLFMGFSIFMAVLFPFFLLGWIACKIQGLFQSAR